MAESFGILDPRIRAAHHSPAVMKRACLPLCGALLFFAVTACPSSHDPTELEREDALAQLADAYCVRIADEPRALWPAREIDRVSREVCVVESARWMARTFVRFGSDDVEACRRAIERADVVDLGLIVSDSRTFPGCEGLYRRGVVAAGEECAWSRECAPNHACRRAPSSCVDGRKVCVPVAGECARDDDCAPVDGEPRFCRPGEPSRCTRFVRAAPAGLGEACGLWHESDPEVDRPCEEGTVCARDGDESRGVCRRPALVGETCGRSAPCEEGAWCDPVTEVCLPVQLGTREGDRCFVDSCDPREGLICHRPDYVCRRSLGDERSACSTRHPAIGCREGFACDLDVCVPLRALGESCGGFSRCESGACADGVCVDRCE